MNTNSVTPELTNLCLLLEDKYFYKTAYFSGRTKYLKFPEKGRSQGANALCLEVYDGVPYLLAVAVRRGESQALRDEVLAHCLRSETIGTVVFYDADSRGLEVMRRKFRDNEFEHVPDLEYYYQGSAGGQPRLLEEKAIYGTSKADASEPSLNAISDRLEDIFFEVHSAMRDIDGLHADAALEELCKLLYLKLYLEEHYQRLPVAPVTTKTFGTAEEYAACLRALYREASKYDIRVFRLKIPEYQRSRGVFDLPIYLSSAALVKSFQIIEGFALSASDSDVKGRAFQKVLNKSIRSGMGQYFTPAEICVMMTAILEPSSADLILDPFCGSGHFLSQSLSYVREHGQKDSKEYHEFAFGKLHGIEKSDRMTRIAMTDMRLHGDGHSNIRCTDSLLDFRNYPDLEAESFDIVVTNPPFGSLLGPEAYSALAKFDLAEGRKKVPLEVVGLERCIQFLRPGGKLAIVLPESVFNAESCKYVREWMATKLVPRIIVDLPAETFTPFGANVRSGILFARKRQPGERRIDMGSVCMIELANVGYDASGRPRCGSDVGEAIEVALNYLKKEGW
jgi:type I restriction enzyme M protein